MPWLSSDSPEVFYYSDLDTPARLGFVESALSGPFDSFVGIPLGEGDAWQRMRLTVCLANKRGASGFGRRDVETARRCLR